MRTALQKRAKRQTRRERRRFRPRIRYVCPVCIEPAALMPGDLCPDCDARLAGGGR